jgi:phosphoribosylformimino-5-aminoimidazole carboxamide ribotide isomerase
MILYPAIDLKDGKAVRLTKGVMESAKIYSDEPWELVKQFESMGASWVHLVDLNGAFAGEPKNLKQIEKIRENCSVKLQLGGGIRDEETIKKMVQIGIDRVILGSVAAKDPEFVKKMADIYPIAVGIDAVDGLVAVQGWGDVSKAKAVDLAAEFKESAVEAIICTDIAKDGTLSGVNVDFTLQIHQACGKEVIASGGVKDEGDIAALHATKNVSGAIIGKAFYEGKLDLAKMLRDYS